MQIIESTPFGVRSAMIRLGCEATGPDVLLFPMIHVGEREFYEDVASRAEECDLILCEGVKSPTVSLLTAAYRYFAQNPNLGLVLQSSVKLDGLEDRILHADVAAADFDKRWAQLPFEQRVLFPLAAPVAGLYLRFFGTKSFISSFLGLNLQESRDELLRDEVFPDAEEITMDWRDRHLVQVLDRECERLGEGRIGVMFGAAHMRAVLRHLMRQRAYKVINMEWMTVFTM